MREKLFDRPEDPVKRVAVDIFIHLQPVLALIIVYHVYHVYSIYGFKTMGEMTNVGFTIPTWMSVDSIAIRKFVKRVDFPYKQ